MIGLIITVAGIIVAMIGVAGSFYAALAQAKAARIQEAQWRQEWMRWQADAESRVAQSIWEAMHREKARRSERQGDQAES